MQAARLFSEWNRSFSPAESASFRSYRMGPLSQNGTTAEQWALADVIAADPIFPIAAREITRARGQTAVCSLPAINRGVWSANCMHEDVL